MSTIVKQQKCRRVISAGNAAATGAGAAIFTKHNNIQNLNTNTRRKCSSAEAIVTTHWSHRSNEKLFIENLEQKHQHKQVTTLWKSTRHFSEQSLNFSFSSAGDAGDYPRQSQIVDDILPRRDFTVYQDGDVSDFFRETEKPERVSEVCLVNDHYILVKMPESYWQRRNSQIECIVEAVNEGEDRIAEDHHRRQVKNAREVLKAETVTAQNGDRKAMISKYFQCHRSRKISPIHEELQEAESSSTIGEELKIKTKNLVQKCWSAADGEEDQEVFMTHTKISKNLVLSKPKVNEVTVKETDKSAQLQNALDLRVKRVRIQEKAKEVDLVQAPSKGTKEKLESPLFGSPLKVSNITATDCQYKTNKILQTSLHDRVLLEHHGSLETSVETIQDGSSLVGPYVMPSAPMTRKKPKNSRHHFNAFRWLLKPFRLRSKTKKPKSKIHAVIYKTYFVRWKKPPDVLWQQYGYGVRRELDEDSTKLRRCRSATF